MSAIVHNALSVAVMQMHLHLRSVLRWEMQFHVLVCCVMVIAAGSSQPAAPFSMELEFKKPILLPNKLTVRGSKDYKAAAAAAGTCLAHVEQAYLTISSNSVGCGGWELIR